MIVIRFSLCGPVRRPGKRKSPQALDALRAKAGLSELERAGNQHGNGTTMVAAGHTRTDPKAQHTRTPMFVSTRAACRWHSGAGHRRPRLSWQTGETLGHFPM